MATIRENKSKGKVISYQFILFLGRDEQGKQMRKYLTWTPPDGLTPAKQRRAAEQAAKQWEKRIREDPRDKQEETKNAEYTAAPERKDDFVSFVNDSKTAAKLIAHICKSAHISDGEKSNNLGKIKKKRTCLY